MTAENIIADLQARGFTLQPNGERLTVAPSSRLTDADRLTIREHKAELLALLSEAERPRKSAREIVAELLARHECPDGCGALVLQDRAGDAWFCPGCRLWVLGNRRGDSMNRLRLCK